VRKRLRVWRDNARAHTGQSSQLFADANDRMPSFFPTHALGITYVPETLKIFANLEDPSVEAGAFVTHNQSKNSLNYLLTSLETSGICPALNALV
jgi:hypothetical protein